MLTHHRKPIFLSLLSTDLPILSVVETAATLYQKDNDRFHLLLTEPAIQERSIDVAALDPVAQPQENPPRLLWLEISPYRVIMTMQGNGKYSYRHFWEQGVYGLSRYWLQSDNLTNNGQIRLRNFTRSLQMKGNPLPQYLRVEYELWSEKLQLGRYVLSLEVHH